MNSRIKIIIGATILSTLFMFQNCSKNGIQVTDNSSLATDQLFAATGSDQNNSSNDPQSSTETTPPVSDTQYICNPFDNGEVSSKYGLTADLSYFDQSKSSTNPSSAFRVKDYFSSNDPGMMKNVSKIYFTSINTISQSFDAGFKISDTDYLSYDNGAKMVEWFALKYETILQLSSNDQPGQYYFSEISDDGSIVEAQINGEWQVIINNDGLHSTKMACTANSIYMDYSTRIPLRIYYYQGPRVTIANVFMMIKADQKPPCSTAVGDDSYWNRSTKQPTSVTQSLFSAGWKIAVQENFLLPQSKTITCTN